MIHYPTFWWAFVVIQVFLSLYLVRFCFVLRIHWLVESIVKGGDTLKAVIVVSRVFLVGYELSSFSAIDSAALFFAFCAKLPEAAAAMVKSARRRRRRAALARRPLAAETRRIDFPRAGPSAIKTRDSVVWKRHFMAALILLGAFTPPRARHRRDRKFPADFYGGGGDRGGGRHALWWPTLIMFTGRVSAAAMVLWGCSPTICSISWAPKQNEIALFTSPLINTSTYCAYSRTTTPRLEQKLWNILTI